MAHKPVPARLLRHPVHFLSLGFGAGLAPVAPGTFGTLVAIPLYYLLQWLPLWGYGLATLLALLVGFYLCDETAKALNVHDHPAIVWDEIVGYFITMTAVPLDWKWIVAGFLLFRLFDIIKPWPIRWIDRQVAGGVGIMLDDVLAGIFAWLGLQAIMFYF